MREPAPPKLGLTKTGRIEPGRIQAADVAAFLDALAPREVRLLAGLDTAALADLLAAGPPTRRPVLRPGVTGVAMR